MIKREEVCCNLMEEYIFDEPETLLRYNEITRSYSFNLYFNKGKYKGQRSPMRQLFIYCPWCGAALPKGLADELDEVLEKEYNITSANWNNEELIPEEFKTDEWWKKRGL